MIKTISWQQYSTAGVAVTGLYYAAILLYYYRKKGPSIIAGKKQDDSPSLIQPAPLSNNSTEWETDPSGMVPDLMDELSAYLQQAAMDQTDKEEIREAITRLLIKYQRLKDSSFLEAINHLIADACERLGKIHFQPEEITAFWEAPFNSLHR